VTSLLFLMVMAAFLAISINTGLLMSTRTQLQAGADSAALAAAGRLDGTTNGLNNARTSALRFTEGHRAYDEQMTITPSADVIFGRWHYSSEDCIASTGTCSAGFESFSDAFAFGNAARVTAVRVINGRDGTRNSVLSLPFGSFVGTPTASVRSDAVAVGEGTGSVDCALPIGVAICKIRPNQASADLRCTEPLTFSNDTNDEVGFVSFDSSPANGNNAGDFINAGMCADGIQVGQVRVQNGNDFGQVIDALRGVGRGNSNGTSTCYIGSRQVLPIIDAGCNENWNNPRFNRDSPIVGFLEVTIRAVTDQNGDVLGCPNDPPPDISDVSNPGRNAVVLDVDCDGAPASAGGLGGGEVISGTAATIRLVQ